MESLIPSLEIEIDDDFKAYILKEDKEPIIHFFGSKVIKLNCSVYLNRAEWANNLDGEKNYDDTEFIFAFLSGKEPEFPEFSRYELARRLWNLNHKSSLEKMEMPNYLRLPV